MEQGDADAGGDLVGDDVHGVGADDEEVGAGGFEGAGDVGEVHGAVVPAAVALDIYRTPATADGQTWTIARRAATDLMSSDCFQTGPKNAADRALVFKLLEQEMLLDYDAVFTAREKRTGKPRTESSFEGALFFQQNLLELIDRIVTPDDLRHRDTILKYGSGLAISKLGRAVKAEVFQQAGTPPRRFYGLVQQSPQTEALRALGYWLDPASTVLTAAERKEYAQVIATRCPAMAFCGRTSTPGSS